MACRLVGANYLNQCWNIINFTLRHKLRRHVNESFYIFIKENAFENIVCQMAAIVSQPQCVTCWSALCSVVHPFIKFQADIWNLKMSQVNNVIFQTWRKSIKGNLKFCDKIKMPVYVWISIVLKAWLNIHLLSTNENTKILFYWSKNSRHVYHSVSYFMFLDTNLNEFRIYNGCFAFLEHPK